MNVKRDEIFVDGIGKLHFIKGLVRFDLTSFQPNEEGGDPIAETKQRIIMPPNGFLETFNVMQQLIDQLLDAGVLTKVDKSTGSSSKKS